MINLVMNSSHRFSSMTNFNHWTRSNSCHWVPSQSRLGYEKTPPPPQLTETGSHINVNAASDSAVSRAHPRLAGWTAPQRCQPVGDWLPPGLSASGYLGCRLGRGICQHGRVVAMRPTELGALGAAATNCEFLVSDAVITSREIVLK